METLSTVISLDSNPIDDKTNTSPSEAFILKFPSKSVETPFSEFLIITLTDGRGLPSWSVTIPLIVCCAKITDEDASIKLSKILFTISLIIKFCLMNCEKFFSIILK